MLIDLNNKLSGVLVDVAPVNEHGSLCKDCKHHEECMKEDDYCINREILGYTDINDMKALGLQDFARFEPKTGSR